MQVYKGKLLGWPQPIAVKVIDTAGVHPERVHERIRQAAREENLVRSCDSKYIVGFLGAFQTRTAVGMVFEVRHESL